MDITNTDRPYTNPGFPTASISKSREAVLAFTQLVDEHREEMERRLHEIRREIELEAEQAKEEKAERELREKAEEEKRMLRKAPEDPDEDAELCCTDSLLGDHFTCSCRTKKRLPSREKTSIL